MKIVLQDAKSSLYMVEPGSWTPRWQEAMTFPNSEKALKFIKAGRLADMQIVLKFPGESHDVVLAAPEPPASRRMPLQPHPRQWNPWSSIPVPAQ